MKHVYDRRSERSCNLLKKYHFMSSYHTADTGLFLAIILLHPALWYYHNHTRLVPPLNPLCPSLKSVLAKGLV